MFSFKIPSRENSCKFWSNESKYIGLRSVTSPKYVKRRRIWFKYNLEFILQLLYGIEIKFVMWNNKFCFKLILAKLYFLFILLFKIYSSNKRLVKINTLHKIVEKGWLGWIGLIMHKSQDNQFSLLREWKEKDFPGR